MGRQAGADGLSGCAAARFRERSQEAILEFDSPQKCSVGWGTWFEFSGFNGSAAGRLF